jgi:hypothetical protein
MANGSYCRGTNHFVPLSLVVHLPQPQVAASQRQANNVEKFSKSKMTNAQGDIG